MVGGQPLFRPEVMDAKRAGWMGTILLIRPLSFTFLAVAAALFATSTLGFLYLGEYTKKARLPGYLVPVGGIPKIYASQPGTITVLRVHEGQKVSRGDVLFILSGERPTPSHQETQEMISRELASRKASLRDDLQRQERRSGRQEEEQRTRMAGMGAELGQVEREIATQRKRLRLSEVTQERYRELEASRFVSELQLQQRTDELLDQQGRLQALERSRLELQ
ncbi:MAG: biotin/lipoyl-binding protein, partial [Pseudonocardiaceae bacterium]